MDVGVAAVRRDVARLAAHVQNFRPLFVSNQKCLPCVYGTAPAVPAEMLDAPCAKNEPYNA
jgi:hypothetical protein